MVASQAVGAMAIAADKSDILKMWLESLDKDPLFIAKTRERYVSSCHQDFGGDLEDYLDAQGLKEALLSSATEWKVVGVDERHDDGDMLVKSIYAYVEGEVTAVKSSTSQLKQTYLELATKCKFLRLMIESVVPTSEDIHSFERFVAYKDKAMKKHKKQVEALKTSFYEFNGQLCDAYLSFKREKLDNLQTIVSEVDDMKQELEQMEKQGLLKFKFTCEEAHIMMEEQMSEIQHLLSENEAKRERKRDLEWKLSQMSESIKSAQEELRRQESLLAQQSSPGGDSGKELSELSEEENGKWLLNMNMILAKLAGFDVQFASPNTFVITFHLETEWNGIGLERTKVHEKKCVVTVDDTNGFRLTNAMVENEPELTLRDIVEVIQDGSEDLAFFVREVKHRLMERLSSQ